MDFHLHLFAFSEYFQMEGCPRIEFVHNRSQVFGVLENLAVHSHQNIPALDSGTSRGRAGHDVGNQQAAFNFIDAPVGNMIINLLGRCLFGQSRRPRSRSSSSSSRRRRSPW